MKTAKYPAKYLLTTYRAMLYNPCMHDTPKPKKYYTVPQTAERLSLDVSTVRRHIAAGHFPGTIRTSPRQGGYRIPEEAIEQFEKDRQL